MGRKKRKPKSETQPKEIKENVSKEVKVDDTFPLKTWGLDVFHKFMKSDDRIFAVAYRVPTGYLASESMVTGYKTEAIKACEIAALKNKLKPNANAVEFKVLPLGEETIIKATFKLINATGKGAIERENIPMPRAGKEGLFVEE